VRKLLLARWKSRYSEGSVQICLTANGPAVVVVNVGGAGRRFESRYPPVGGPRSSPGGQATMAQFLRIPAKVLIVSLARICLEPDSESW